MSHDSGHEKGSISAAAAMASPPYRFTYHLGLYLGINAIPDAYALIDGPDCLLRKAEWVHGKHDWHSTILDALGAHRVVATFMESERVVKSRGDEVAVRVAQIAQQPGARLVLVCSMPHVMIIGTQYDKILRRMQPEVSCRLLEVPSRSLDGDYLDGYAAVMTAIADDIDLKGRTPDPSKVAIVGYLMDRNEADHGANLRELGRMCAALGLELCSTWLSGVGFDQLAEAGDAGTIVALPTGLAAARSLAQRTGAKLVELPTPFGSGRTQRFLRMLARATGREELAEVFIEGELARLVPRLEWAVPHVFASKRIGFSGSPELFGGLLDMASELGMEVTHLSAAALSHHLREDLAAEFGRVPTPVFAPTVAGLDAALDAAPPFDLLIGDSEFLDVAGVRAPLVEHGFPAHFDHALTDRPFLGFEGWITFVDRMASAMTRGRRTLDYLMPFAHLARQRLAEQERRDDGAAAIIEAPAPVAARPASS